MTNFDYLFGEKRFASFSGAAAAAEKIFAIDTAACAVNARRAAELAVKWMYEHDRQLPEPKRDQMAALTGTAEFRALVGTANLRALDYIRHTGNDAAHNPDRITKKQAELSLTNLYTFTLYVAKRYSQARPLGQYDRSLLDPEAELVTEAFSQADIRELIAENRALKRLVSTLRKDTGENRDPELVHPTLSEADTRRLYIESALAHAGWHIGVNCRGEYPVQGLPGKSGVGYVDYALLGEDGVPLAIVEAQAKDVDVGVGRQQAKLYADALEKRHGQRPVIFLSNGHDTRIWFDHCESERPLGGFYSPADLLRVRALQAARRLPTAEDIAIAPMIRPYQKQAMEAAAQAICAHRQRSAVISMAPATGKTRTSLFTADLLRRCGWVQNVLFLSENELLSTQALREFTAAFPAWRAAALSDHRNAAEAEVLFSPFADLAADADEVTDKSGALLLTAGHFDLIVCDETDRAALFAAQEALLTFDAPILALTSAPGGADPLLTELVGGAAEPIFSYTYEEAVADGWIVPFAAVELDTALMRDGVDPATLPPEEKQKLEAALRERGEELPDAIHPTEFFTEYVSPHTVELALLYLREHGRMRGNALGKTVIFTENHAHSEYIYRTWARLFQTDPPHICRVIDTSVNYVRSLLDDFTAPDTMPRVALSHDILRDGVDLPSVENLVFFTRTSSRSAFWRMLGRGMRRCEGLSGGKPDFFVLDLCGNFRTHESGTPRPAEDHLTPRGANFVRQVRLAAALQRLGRTPEETKLRDDIVNALISQIASLDMDSFSARRRAAAITPFRQKSAFDALSASEVSALCRDVAPLMVSDGTSERETLFTGYMYDILLGRLEGQEYSHARAAVVRMVRVLSTLATHKAIQVQKKRLNRILYNRYLDTATPAELEEARKQLLPLIRYLPKRSGTLIPLPLPDHIVSESVRGGDNTRLS